MRPTSLPFLLVLLTASMLQACAKPTASDSEAATSPAAASTATPPLEADGATEKAQLNACALVTPQEMSVILGSVVSGEPNDRSNGKTECIYKPADGVSPYVEFSVDWGEGEAAMTAAGTMNQREPGITDPYEGLGDQAVSIGPVLMVRTGEDLVTLTFSGVEDIPSKAKKIFDTAKARM